MNRPVRPRIRSGSPPRRAERDAHRRDRRRWLPLFFVPERTQAAFGPALAAGLAKRDPPSARWRSPPADAGHNRRPPTEAARLRDLARPRSPSTWAAWGPRGANFYNALVRRYAGRPRRRRSEPLPWPARRPKPRRPSRPSCWRRPRWWARKASSRTASAAYRRCRRHRPQHRAPRPRSSARGAPHVVALTPSHPGRGQGARPSHSSSASRSAAGWGRAK